MARYLGAMSSEEKRSSILGLTAVVSYLAYLLLLLVADASYAPLIRAPAEGGYFWIANALYLGFTLSAVFGSVARVCAYRWGLPGRHAW